MEKTCGNVVNLLQDKKHKDESLSNAILLNEQANLLRWTNPNVAITWEEVFLQQHLNTGLAELLDRVNSPPQFTARQFDTLAAFLNIAHMSTAVANLLQHTIVDFRKYRANGEDMLLLCLQLLGLDQGTAVMSVASLNMMSGSLVRLIAYFLASGEERSTSLLW
ncbi:uncharacterized protein V1513DRAFT_333096 [Lipomyces chichibuensis]|uniref:uncharacterized protein n=1 Tax=Lipomyces chichibuensis TaxID=1546026 RepID=UPI0033440E02